jgi:hypothetical protein
LIDWQELNIVTGASNSNVPQMYSVKDYKNSDAEIYYRLKQTDFDGHYEYFTPVVAKCTPKHNFVTGVYPNPIINIVNLTVISDCNTILFMDIKNLLGQSLLSIECDVKKGFNIFNIDLFSVNKGMYLMSVYNDTYHQTHKIIKK